MVLQLSDNYIPKKILFREEQISELKEVFKNFKKWKVGTNLALFGVTGSGKTTIIKSVIKGKNNSVYISGANTKSPCNTLKKIVGSKKQNFCDIQKEIIDKLKKEPKIIIIDEIDKINRLNELFNSLNFIYRETQVPIIISTLKRDIIEKMPIDARKTLFFERINLPSYNAIELQKILKERLKEGSIKIKELGEGTIAYICALASRQGSARIMLKLTLRCMQKGTFKKDFIDETFVKMMKDDMFEFINEVNPTEKEFLRILMERCDWNSEIRSGELEKLMLLSSGRISQLANTFEKYGIIISRTKNLGRMGGRQRYIRFVSEEVFKDLDKIGKF